MEIKLTDGKVAEIKKNGLSTDDYWILNKMLESNKEVLFCDIPHLLAKGWVDVNQNLASKAKDLIEKLEKNSSIEKTDFTQLYFLLQGALSKTYGKKQVKGFGGKPFLPTERELKEFLTRFWKKYPEYTDITKISKILISHVATCAKSGKFAPAVCYYIGKTTDDGYSSPLANLYESWEDKEIQKKEDKPKEIKNLF